MEAIVLAGGLGTRLSQSLPAGVPKALATVAGRPFLFWLLEHLGTAGFTKVILSVGWQADGIIQTIGSRVGGLMISYCREDTPLGTGGALRSALSIATLDTVFAMNGDTFLEVDYRAMLKMHMSIGSVLTLTSVKVADASRYGSIVTRGHRLVRTVEKGMTGPANINGGTYLLSRTLLDDAPSGPFSFEAEILVKGINRLKPAVFPTSGRFIDIGVPEGLARAQQMFAAR